MPRFLLGDELGNIKALRYDSQAEDSTKAKIKTLVNPTHNQPGAGVQCLTITDASSSSNVLAAAYSDGRLSTYHLHEDDSLTSINEWTEPRLRDGQRWVGLAVSNEAVYSCTSNGALRMTPLDSSQGPALASLPTRLADWKLAPNRETFAYGGDEVDLSVWDTERTFSTPLDSASLTSTPKKRKRGEDLFPGEVWRAKNVANDSLGLRQPVRITSLTYLSPCSPGHHLLTGTQLGDVRRHDTRGGRRPVADWKGIGKVGGIKTVEKGLNENEVFVSDHGCNLFAMDLRTGRVSYAYKGIAGAVNSIAPSPGIMVSTALDRLARIHSVYPPPDMAGQPQDKKGQVMEKIFTTSLPTVVVWDQGAAIAKTNGTPEEDEIWDHMEVIGTSGLHTS